MLPRTGGRKNAMFFPLGRSFRFWFVCSVSVQRFSSGKQHWLAQSRTVRQGRKMISAQWSVTRRTESLWMRAMEGQTRVHRAL